GGGGGNSRGRDRSAVRGHNVRAARRGRPQRASRCARTGSRGAAAARGTHAFGRRQKIRQEQAQEYGHPMMVMPNIAHHLSTAAPEEILRPVQPWFIVVTIVLALLANLVPATGVALALKPDFIALVLLY